MKTRPILFSAPMVLALLAGRKTQTRRIIKPQPHLVRQFDGVWAGSGAVVNMFHPLTNRFGSPGDRLWVRETFLYIDEKAKKVDYRADTEDGPGRWKPSIFMPRWASRLTLEVTEVRVERLQDISEADAIAEGTTCWVCDGRVDGLSENDCECFHTKAAAVPSYRALWESINGDESWSANPWVWVVSFRRQP